MNPELIDAAVSIGLTLFGLVATYAAAKIAQKAGIDVEQTHIDRIKAAVSHVARAALADGKTDIGEITELSLAYLRANLPAAMNKVRPSNTAIQTIAKAQIESVVPVTINVKETHAEMQKLINRAVSEASLLQSRLKR